MSINDGHDSPEDLRDEKYESTVLDFLNKELAAAQPIQKQKNQSDDLDALVSDLMKQVITESDQSHAGHKSASDDLGQRVPELSPEQERPSPRAVLRQSASVPQSSRGQGFPGISKVARCACGRFRKRDGTRIRQAG
jgi:hypothetical protein